MAELSRVRNGTYQGECFVYCNEEVTAMPQEVRYDLTSPVPDADHPDVHASEPLAPDRWSALTDAAARSALDELPRQIGLAEARDAGGEFVEVAADDRATRVDFGLGEDVPQASPLLDQLRELRRELASRHRPA